MEIIPVSENQREILRRPLPPEAVSKHPTKTFLSSIKSIYVTERMNEAFGVGSWNLKVEHVLTTEKSMVVVKVTFTIPRHGIYLECFGGNDNGGESSKNFDLGDAYKGATTDALSKIGSYLEIGHEVFKGIHGKTQPTASKVLPEMTSTHPNWGKVVEGLRNGATIEQVRTKYTLSAANEKLLKDAIS